jgi:YtkA-like protein
MTRLLASSFAVLFLLATQAPQYAQAHGGVVEEEDLCVIKVNYLRGHFKIYQPLIDGHKEYCEDLPNATETVFVMEYLHDSLGEAAVDFRIIRDVTGKGRFARWEDVAEIDDLEAVTILYREPTVDPDVLTVIHDFKEEGQFIGIVTANVNGDQKIYRAVFPFEVGYTGLGYWPFFILLLLAIQLQYFFMSGRFKRWRENRAAAAVVALLLLCAPISDVVAEEWVSTRGVYVVNFESSLEPIEINQIHSWTLRITSDGEPVTGASLAVSGGMTAHDHGMPTRPRVTAELGNGEYRLEGMRFHMGGDWEVFIEIKANGKTDTVVVTLAL